MDIDYCLGKQTTNVLDWIDVDLTCCPGEVACDVKRYRFSGSFAEVDHLNSSINCFVNHLCNSTLILNLFTAPVSPFSPEHLLTVCHMWTLLVKYSLCPPHCPSASWSPST